MGRLDADPVPQSSVQTPFQPPPQQGYHHNQAPPPPQDAYLGDNDQNMNHPQSTRSYIPQQAENPPPPKAYPPQQPQGTYPPQQPAPYPPQRPAPYPPQQSAAPYAPQRPAPYPPQQSPAPYPPQRPGPYPPQQSPVAYPPQPQPVPFPPPSQQMGNYVSQPQMGGPTWYQTQGGMGAQEGIATGSQYLDPTQEWGSDLFDCMDDPENAIVTAFFPFVTFGQIAEIVDNGQTSCATSGILYGVIAAFGIPWIMSYTYRTEIRNRYGLMETPASDWVTHWLFEWCALCQEYRELKARGMDPAIGWEGNLAKNQQRQQYPAMTPPMNQTMMS